jgi:hypothetical protein
MANWRDHILQAFIPQLSPLTLVADPDRLLAETEILQGIQDKGFEVLLFEDSVEFRFAYEAQHHPRWLRGEPLELVVVLQGPPHDLRRLPYDLYQNGRRLAFSLSDLFPNLSYLVVSALEINDLDILYQAQAQQKPTLLGENASKDFILHYVYDLEPDLLTRPSELLRVLLRLHYRRQSIPTVVCDRLVERLRFKPQFENYPLEQLFSDHQAFLAFLQQQWVLFIQQKIPKAKLASTYAGVQPITVPFDHEDVKVYIDNFFLEGYLKPVPAVELGLVSTDLSVSEWVNVGIQTDVAQESQQRFAHLIEIIAHALEVAEPKYQDWLTLAPRWAELLTLRQTLQTYDPAADELSFQLLQQRLDNTFLSWVQPSYGKLYNQPSVSPVMLHHIPRVLARHLNQSDHSKVALLLLDGLAFDQWFVLRGVLQQQCTSLKFRESAVFAWAPTITSVSRQAAFAGKIPFYFPGSINSTDRESTLWQQFWLDQSVKPVNISYARKLGEQDSLSKVETLLSEPRLRVLGLVVDTVDEIMHGMKMGTAGMHNQVRQWAETGFMATLINLLLEHGFKLFLTSDHGNIEAVGIGRPSEGTIADRKGERVRIYTNPTLRAQARQKFPDTIAWQPTGLPENYFPLFAPARTAFIPEGDRIVGHGGITIEELIVPFVEIDGSPS